MPLPVSASHKPFPGWAGGSDPEPWRQRPPPGQQPSRLTRARSGHPAETGNRARRAAGAVQRPRCCSLRGCGRRSPSWGEEQPRFIPGTGRSRSASPPASVPAPRRSCAAERHRSRSRPGCPSAGAPRARLAGSDRRFSFRRKQPPESGCLQSGELSASSAPSPGETTAAL